MTRRSASVPDITGVDVNVLSADISLTSSTDESYNLTVIVCFLLYLTVALVPFSSVMQAPRIQIVANSVFGALHGIETLSQLVYRGMAINQTTIVDFPRFPLRAVMIDTARHWCNPCMPMHSSSYTRLHMCAQVPGLGHPAAH